MVEVDINLTILFNSSTTGGNIFELDKIFVPVNTTNTHWSCAVIFMQTKRIVHLDSLGYDGTKYVEFLLQYINDEHKHKMGKPMPNPGDWKILVPHTRYTPVQRNTDDCGVFTCMFAEFISVDCGLVFDRTHIPKCRELIALSIMQGEACVTLLTMA